MRRSNTLVLLVLVIMTVAGTSRAVIQCNQVLTDLIPCLKYLGSGTGAPPADCCAGVNNLASAAVTTDDRRAACGCIETAAKSMQPNTAAAKGLISGCGVNLPFDVSPTMDCSKIN